jgi:hypothetical protein
MVGRRYRRGQEILNVGLAAATRVPRAARRSTQWSSLRLPGEIRPVTGEMRDIATTSAISAAISGSAIGAEKCVMAQLQQVLDQPAFLTRG